ncbi:uncharacterized protein B0H18DRAFT_1084659 [Fomitopsis serialis]|uniref:uncharacterized protein n=1 Tax=Fomitopsis serialis TaxID=139415 RepID=UPI00200821F8|nr:uncharacterized protein B0H18DRAFT_1084659 [Neoantrodia serialis]KAH9927802.1 hypothetical protein B0H18DRAFT_1084659 [Neoantrodia serialis]
MATAIDHWSAILTFILFVLSSTFLAVCLPYVTHLHFNFITVPLVSVLLPLATGAIDGTVVRDGIVGANGVQPLDIMALFISLAYLSISLDATGLLRFLAFWVVRKGGGSGRRLFTYLYVFFLVCGVIVGNDPVILSGTAFLAYLTRVSGVANPKAWLFSQFAAANMASVVLVSSNPTNLVLSGAFALKWTSYIAHVVLPFLAAAATVYPLLLYMFRASDLIPDSLDLDLDEVGDMRETLVDKGGAIFGSCLVFVTLGVLVGTSTVGVPVWEVTVPPACIMLARDVWWDWSRHQSLKSASSRSTEQRLSRDAPPRVPSTLAGVVRQTFTRIKNTFPTVSSIASRLPIPLLPFAFLTFILVNALSTQGWVSLFAGWWGAWVRATGTLGAVGGMGFLSCIFCNVCGTNIGATILLARLLQLWIAAASPSEREQYGAVYALALGSNFGAFTLTFSASLAGLLWRRILRQKGIHVRAREFLRINLPIAGVAMTVGCVVLVGEVYVIYK